MRRLHALALAAAAIVTTAPAHALDISTAQKAWSTQHDKTGGYLSEIVSFDALTRTLWVSGVTGVDVLDARTGALVQRIDTSAWGSINSVTVRNGLAAFAIESTVRTDPGKVVLFDTASRSPATGVNQFTVGALPDMLTFTADGSRLLVANEGTPSTYGARLADSGGHRNYGPAATDPLGSVSIIDVVGRTVLGTPTLNGVPVTGPNVRVNTGMNFEPEYIAVNAAGTKAWVTLQEANALGVLNLQTLSFEQVVGLGAKDFSLPGNRIDPLNNGTVNFINVAAKGLYMPDGIAAYDTKGQTYLVMANEGDFREDDADRSAASSFGASAPLNALRVSNTDSSTGQLFAAGGRSFSIRDAAGNLVYDSGDELDIRAAALGIYDDNRSRDKGVEPEGVSLITLGGRTYAFIGLERTTKSAVAVYDVTDPTSTSYLNMLVSDGDISPEGLSAYLMDGHAWVAFSNEVSSTTTVFDLGAHAVPEPQALALLATALMAAGWARRRRG